MPLLSQKDAEAVYQSDFDFDELHLRSFMRYDSSCLEEYILKRDLRFKMSKFKRLLDPIVLLEKYPFLLSMSISNASEESTSSEPISSLMIFIFMTTWSLLMRVIIKLVFPMASNDAIGISFILNCIGSASIGMAFCIMLLNGMMSLRFVGRFIGADRYPEGTYFN